MAAALEAAPVIGVVRTASAEEGLRQARAFRDAGLQVIEITFTVPDATGIVRTLIAERDGEGPPWFGMGTVTGRERAEAAVATGAAFLVSPNASAEVAAAGRAAGVFVVLGALTPTEIVAARDAGADLVKVYPLPPVGGARYLATVRQPLDDIPMLAAGGFPPEEIPEYRAAGARAFGIGSSLLGPDDRTSRERIARALAEARGEGAGGRA